MQGVPRQGDFTGLAGDYSQYRPDYCPSILNGLFGLLKKRPADVDFVDVGAGTGIWTRMVQAAGVKSAVAVEPNADMRAAGMADSASLAVAWLPGSAEKTGLGDQVADWVTMASSFHWADFESSTREFHRILRPEGRFTALWNPRLIELNPLLMEIEEHLSLYKKNIKRVSSGRSGITDRLTEMLWGSTYFDDVVYLEGRHVIQMSPERYVGAWRSVNDLQAQLGSDNFSKFLRFVESKVASLPFVEATYLTRAWSARRKG
ncbi:class I SAM-dependent methyltransferase [Castellaniella caeni]|uniref:class I SAM-dependent methyltransferase n=1 Tax=Castellaniella caeni TaxID=266123 RepID=UPI000A01BF76|nr:class I SAM-dependent methyltransferase [Castellaniella caeni]